VTLVAIQNSATKMRIGPSSHTISEVLSYLQLFDTELFWPSIEKEMGQARPLKGM